MQPTTRRRRTLRWASCLLVPIILSLLLCGITGAAVVVSHKTVWFGNNDLQFSMGPPGGGLSPDDAIIIGPGPWGAMQAQGGSQCIGHNPILLASLFQIMLMDCRP